MNLRKQLEAEGWEWITNIEPDIKTIQVERDPFFLGRPEKVTVDVRVPKRTDEELRQEYLDMGFVDVRIEDAYGAPGTELERIHFPELRAVYVKR